MADKDRMLQEVLETVKRLKVSLAEFEGILPDDALAEINLCMDSSEFYLVHRSLANSKKEIENAIALLKKYK